MKRNRPLVVSLILSLLCAILLVGLVGCSSEDGEVGNFIDRTLWDMRGYPSQQEILDSLEDKYGEEFGILSLNSGARFFQGIAFPLSDPDLHFSLEMKDEQGNPMPIEYMRDDYQARLAEQYIQSRLMPIFTRALGADGLYSLRAEVALFDRVEDTSLPKSFDWLPSDGLELLAAEEEVTVLMSVHVIATDAAQIEGVNLEDLADAISLDPTIPLSGDLFLRASDQSPEEAQQARIN
jgi:hypothetical protein